jgi:hypothetical protein
VVKLDYRTMRLRTGIFIILLVAASATAQLAVTVTPPKVVGQKAVVQLTMTNNLADKIESARAICFLLDGQGRMVGESSRWVIGGTKERPALEPKQAATFNFVVTSPQPFTTTNLTAKISFSRVVLDGGKLADVRQDVSVSEPAK